MNFSRTEWKSTCDEKIVITFLSCSVILFSSFLVLFWKQNVDFVCSLSWFNFCYLRLSWTRHHSWHAAWTYPGGFGSQTKIFDWISNFLEGVQTLVGTLFIFYLFIFYLHSPGMQVDTISKRETKVINISRPSQGCFFLGGVLHTMTFIFWLKNWVSFIK